MNKTILKYRKNGHWYKYKGKLPDTIEAVLTTETMTMQDIKKHFPEQYLTLKAHILSERIK
jgi:hypothetical protein